MAAFLFLLFTTVHCGLESAYTVLQTGDATYYGLGSDSGGNCMLNTPQAVKWGEFTIALNAPQYSQGGCGMCIELWSDNLVHPTTNAKCTQQSPCQAFVNNQLPEGKLGDIDIALNGDGRWKVTWRAVPCTFGNLQYVQKTGSSEWFVELQVRSHQFPLKSVAIQVGGTWKNLERQSYNYWKCPQCTYPVKYPLNVRVVDVMGNEFNDVIQSNLPDKIQTGKALGKPTTTSPAAPSPAASPAAPSPKVSPNSISSSPTSATQCRAKALRYDDALKYSYWFFQAQRSGTAGPDVQNWRLPCFASDTVNGGWFDAGDHVKFTFTIAYAATALAWDLLEFPQGHAAVSAGAGRTAYDLGVSEVKFGADYIVASWRNGVQVVQIGDGHADHAAWDACWRESMARPATTGLYADVLGESAATLAAASMVVSADMTLAKKYLDTAKTLYTAMKGQRNTYGNQGFYGSDNYVDEQAWAAAWLWRATGDSTYLSDAKGYLSTVGWGWGTQSWNNKGPGASMLLCIYGNHGCDAVVGALNGWVSCTSVQCPGGRLRVLDQWGVLRYWANTAFLAAVYGVHKNDKKMLDFASDTVNYILGDNPAGRSYVVGVGPNSPKNPHHRNAHATCCSCGSGETKNILYGALVGGPTSDMGYKDDRCDYQINEVAIDYQGLWTGAVAFMVQCTHATPSTDYCKTTQCGHGSCQNLAWTAVCTCDAGWGGDHCDVQDTNDCLPNPCLHGTCTDTGIKSFKCACDAGWSGTLCDTQLSCGAGCSSCLSAGHQCDSGTWKCCNAGLACYTKDQYWSSCQASCVPGVHADEPVQYQTPWSCAIIGDLPVPSPTNKCANVVCKALDTCLDAGVCDPNTGGCSQPVAPNGRVCNDGDPTTTNDVCQAGICRGSTAKPSPSPSPRPASPSPRPASPSPRPASPSPRPASPSPRSPSPAPTNGPTISVVSSSNAYWLAVQVTPTGVATAVKATYNNGQVSDLDDNNWAWSISGIHFTTPVKIQVYTATGPSTQITWNPPASLVGPTEASAKPSNFSWTLYAACSCFALFVITLLLKRVASRTANQSVEDPLL